MHYFFLFLLIITIFGAVFAPQRTGIILRYTYYLRVPILFGPLFLLVLAFLGYTSPNALQNGLITDRPIQVFILSFQAAFLSLLFIYYREHIWIHAQERFNAPPSPFSLPDRSSGSWNASMSEVAAILLATPFIAVIILVSETENWTRQGLAFVAVLGVVLAHLSVLWIREHAADDLGRLISGTFARLPPKIRRRLGPGYFTPQDPPQFYEGHAKSTFLALLTFAFYILGFILLHPSVHAAASQTPFHSLFAYFSMAVTPAAYVLGIAMFLMTFFCGLTYFSDRYNIPLITVLLVLTYMASRIQGQNNLFPIHLAQPTAPAALNPEGLLEESASGKTISRPPYSPPVPVTQAFANRLDLLARTALPSDSKPDTIVVCASGGGIQAAAWTVEVLTGLDEITDGRFSQRIQLISATSGGSLGSLYYLDGYNLIDGGNTLDGAQTPPRQNYFDHLYRVRRAASKSGLEDILWGFYQLDLPRSLGIAPWLPPLHDRGWALEMNWRNQLRNLRTWRQEQTGRVELESEALTMNSLAHFTAQGLIPPVIFNSTIVENGRQIAFSSATFPERPAGDSILAGYTFHDRFQPTATRGIPEAQTSNLIPDIDRSTAVRLSAAFPYISPVARSTVEFGVDSSGARLPAQNFTVPSPHLTDGGFFDNLGFLGGMEWIRTIAEHPELAQRAGRIVILQILDREETLTGTKRDITGAEDSWQMSLLGPIQTIFNVRGTTQTSRTNLELGMLRDLYPGLEIEFIPLGPRSYGEEHTPPISWKLSNHDLTKLQESWLLHLWENDQLKNFVQRLKK